MCGIVGKYNFGSRRPVDQVLLDRMRDSMAHRGPDGKGTFVDDDYYIGLAHRRLSIIDVSGGSQPMSNRDQSIWIVFNGEIYNFPELKSELQSKGYRFSTRSDTETIIYLYEEYGTEAFHRLNGIFSMGIFDRRDGSVVLTRDHFGVKPMYYSLSADGLTFASEIKAILSERSARRELDMDALNTFLTLRYNPSPQTMFGGIRKLPPGYFLRAGSNGRVEVESFWPYSPVHLDSLDEEACIRTYQDKLEAAVSRQMISDVPVGLMLSGGVDSAAIGRIMKDVATEKVMSFTVGFPGNGDFNELDDARISARHIGSQHFELEISQKEYLDFFFKSFTFSEEPIAEPTIPALYYVSKLAASKVKVVLAGQGADEPLAGYKRYFGERNLDKYGWLLARLPLATLARFIPRNERFKRAVYSSRFGQELERFLAVMTIFTPAQKERLLRPEIRKRMNDVDLEMMERTYRGSAGLDDSLSRLLFLDTRTMLADDLLLFGDKMTMANSLEMRVPFLDVELIKFLESLPANMKLRGRTHKYIHKRAVEKWLPRDIIYRKKRGFATPMDEWLQNDLAAFARKLLRRRGSACREFFNLDFVDHMVERHSRKKENYQRQLFALMSFEVWYTTFFANESIEGFFD